jgi:hypothetical protein
MKKVSTKQNQRHIRLMKKRTLREDKRKVVRSKVVIQMNKIKIAGRRIQKAQKRMMRLARG